VQRSRGAKARDAKARDARTRGWGRAKGQSQNAIAHLCPLHTTNRPTLSKHILLAMSKCEVDFGIFDQGVKQFLMKKLFLKNIRVINVFDIYTATLYGLS
jgi:hypothetical protein